MSGRDFIETSGLPNPKEKATENSTADTSVTASLLQPLLRAKPTPVSRLDGVVIGELVAMTDNGETPLVLFPGQQGSAAVPARTTLDLHGKHVGQQVTLMFERGDPAKPIVMGVLRKAHNDLAATPGHVEIESEGERFLVTAKEQLVLRCGKASITLTKDGKVLIQGSYISSRSTGVNRVKGGSVQLN